MIGDHENVVGRNLGSVEDVPMVSEKAVLEGAQNKLCVGGVFIVRLKNSIKPNETRQSDAMGVGC